MNSLLKSFATVLTTLVMSGIVAVKIRDVLPDMDRTAWIVVAAGFALWIFVAIRIGAWLEKIFPGRFSEDQNMWLSVLLSLVFGVLLVILGWGLIGGLLAPHFGPVNLD